jgi:hypothetical protein
MKSTILVLGILAASLGSFGCGDEEEAQPSPMQGPIEIEGTWTSNFGATEIIGGDVWASESPSFTSEARIEEYSNATNEAVTQNPEDDAFNPSLYNRIVWTEIDGGSFYYCTTDFGLESAATAAALNTPVDASNPEEEGCGDFAWTKLTRQ